MKGAIDVAEAQGATQCRHDNGEGLTIDGVEAI